jgi:hypothetical protein
MFKRITDVKPEQKNYLKKLPSHFPIREPATLLEYRNIAPYVAQMPKIVNAPKEYYDALYKAPLLGLANFVQGLPASKINQFSHYGGLLELGCRRALKTLQHYRQEYPITNIKPENMPPRLALWTYALFTAGLFYGIGEVIATYWVGVCDDQGKHSIHWEPFKGPMSQLGTHYLYCFESINRDQLAARSTPLVAKHLLPIQGYNWIASDKEIFSYWLALLQNDDRGAGVLAKMVRHAHDLLLQEIPLQQVGNVNMPFMDEGINPKGSESLLSLANADKISSVETAATTNLDLNNPQATNVGDAFVSWLRNNLRNGAMTVNLPDSLIHLGRDGIVVLHPDIFNLLLLPIPSIKPLPKKYGVALKPRVIPLLTHVKCNNIALMLKVFRVKSKFRPQVGFHQVMPQQTKLKSLYCLPH